MRGLGLLNWKEVMCDGFDTRNTESMEKHSKPQLVGLNCNVFVLWVGIFEKIGSDDIKST